jgi:hypothetical protein
MTGPLDDKPQKTLRAPLIDEFLERLILGTLLFLPERWGETEEASVDDFALQAHKDIYAICAPTSKHKAGLRPPKTANGCLATRKSTGPESGRRPESVPTSNVAARVAALPCGPLGVSKSHIRSQLFLVI